MTILKIPSRYLLLFLGFFLFVGAILWFKSQQNTRDFIKFSLNDTEFTAVVSHTNAEITQGLSDRKAIGADAMLFVLPQPARHEFWMYRMHFPLDFIWISEGKVVDLHRSVPVPKSPAIEEIPTVSPKIAADSVLEAPAGFIDQHGIKEGQDFKLTSSFFRQVW